MGWLSYHVWDGLFIGWNFQFLLGICFLQGFTRDGSILAGQVGPG